MLLQLFGNVANVAIIDMNIIMTFFNTNGILNTANYLILSPPDLIILRAVGSS